MQLFSSKNNWTALSKSHILQFNFFNRKKEEVYLLFEAIEKLYTFQTDVTMSYKVNMFDLFLLMYNKTG